MKQKQRRDMQKSELAHTRELSISSVILCEFSGQAEDTVKDVIKDHSDPMVTI